MHLQYSFEPRWSDLDPNMHMRHSAYYDFCAQVRVNILNHIGCSMLYLKNENCLPILFREEALFKKEIKAGLSFNITTEVVGASIDFKKWSFSHTFLDAENQVLCISNVDGAWLDGLVRKIKTPSDDMQHKLNLIPRSSQFKIIS